MIPRPVPPVPPAVLDDPTEFARQTDYATNYGGPRRFALVTRGSWSSSGRSDVVTPENTRSAAP